MRRKAAPAGEAAKEESREPSAALKWGNFIVLAAGLGYLIGKSLAPAIYRKRTAEIQKDIAEAQAIKKDAEARRVGGCSREGVGRGTGKAAG